MFLHSVYMSGKKQQIKLLVRSTQTDENEAWRVS